MPEGDTIYRTAARLREALLGAAIEAATAREPALDAKSLVGGRVDRIESRGKHLLIWLARKERQAESPPDLAIHSHLGMSGAWHVYEPGQSWQKPEWQAALSLETSAARAVCFNPKTLELLTASQVKRHRWLSRLGPDLLAEPFDDEAALRRLRTQGAAAIGEAIMNQSAVCGVGNVYKSECLFLEQLDPLAPVSELTEEQLRSLLARARRLMKRNLAGYPRQTRFVDSALKKWVYGRRGEPCLKCGEKIQLTRQGDLGRTTYYCPACQRVGHAARE